MKKLKVSLVALALMAGATANAQGLSDILKGLGGAGGDVSSTIGNLIEGVFSKSDITLEDLVGDYVSTGPAVTFKSDNFLQKAGGVAGAAALETKLQPYYEQYGLTGMTLVVNDDASFIMTVKGIKLSGTVTRNDGDGTFTFNLMAMGMKVGQFTAYVEKTGKNLNLMFDATKLKEIISTVGKFSGMTIAKTLGTILDSYDGACVGFKMENTGKNVSSSQGNTPASTGSSTRQDSGNDGSALNSLKDLLNKRKK